MMLAGLASLAALCSVHQGKNHMFEYSRFQKRGDDGSASETLRDASPSSSHSVAAWAIQASASFIVQSFTCAGVHLDPHAKAQCFFSPRYPNYPKAHNPMYPCRHFGLSSVGNTCADSIHIGSYRA